MFGILELRNGVTKLSDTKWRHTSSCQLENIYKNCYFVIKYQNIKLNFEVLTRNLNF